jgi:hypothetical protein
VRRSRVHARRRAVLIAAPIGAAGGALFAATALAGNGATLLGAGMLVGAAVAALLDLEHPENEERA